MIRAALVLLAAHLIIARLRGRSAAERHGLWVAAVAVAALLPLVAGWLPVWHADFAQRIADALPTAALRSTPAGPRADIVVRAVGIETSSALFGPWLAAVWALGAAMALVLFAIEAGRLARLAASAREATSARWQRIAAEVADGLALSRRPRLLVGDRACMPITWGVVAPRVLLPACATTWSDARLRSVLAHELAHIRRGDWLTHVLTEIACAVYWFHPLFWLAQRRLR